MKKIMISLTFISLFMIKPTAINATSGALRSSSIITCNGNTYGYHGEDKHWHLAELRDNGKWYPQDAAIITTNPCANSGSDDKKEDNTDNKNNDSSSGGSNTNNGTSNNPVIIKSNDNSLKTLEVKSTLIDINDSMTYSTFENSVNINAVTNDSKAVAEYDKEIELTDGENLIIIKVIAEDGSVKEYNLIIIKERKLSSNKNITIIVDEQIVKFNSSYESDVIYLSNDKKKIDIEYRVEDETTKVYIVGNENLNVGKSQIIIQVIAENGEQQNYKLNVERYDKEENTTDDALATIIGLGFFGGIGYGVYAFVKKLKVR